MAHSEIGTRLIRQSIAVQVSHHRKRQSQGPAGSTMCLSTNVRTSFPKENYTNFHMLLAIGGQKCPGCLFLKLSKVERRRLHVAKGESSQSINPRSTYFIYVGSSDLHITVTTSHCGRRCIKLHQVYMCGRCQKVSRLYVGMVPTHSVLINETAQNSQMLKL